MVMGGEGVEEVEGVEAEGTKETVLVGEEGGEGETGVAVGEGVAIPVLGPIS